MEVAGQTQFRASMAYLHSSSHTTWSRTEGQGHGVPCPSLLQHRPPIPCPMCTLSLVQPLQQPQDPGTSSLQAALHFSAGPRLYPEPRGHLGPAHPATKCPAQALPVQVPIILLCLCPALAPGTSVVQMEGLLSLLSPAGAMSLGHMPGPTLPPALSPGAPANLTWNLFSGLRICTYRGQLGAKSFTAQARRMVWWSWGRQVVSAGGRYRLGGPHPETSVASLTAAVRSTSFLLLRMKQASPLSIL